MSHVHSTRVAPSGARAFLVLLLGALAVSGCALWQDAPPADDRCGEARNLLLACGAQVALFERASCAGPSLFAAECVLDQGGICEDLGKLSESCARVIADELGSIDLPEPPDECDAPPSLSPGVVYELDGRQYRVDGLAYCVCAESVRPERELCAHPGALVYGGGCRTPCEGSP